MDEFLVRAALGGVGVAVLAGPIGCFVVWRRMAYFGATLSHAALLGVALGFLLDLDLHLAILAVCTLISLGLYLLDRNPQLASDTLLGILAHSSLALGLVLIGLLDRIRIDLLGYLFGDVLSVSWTDVVWIWVAAALCLALLGRLWTRLLTMTVHEDLARVEGIAVERMRLAFLLLVSVMVALSMQIVGLLLTVSLLILPPATARRVASSPEQMACIATALGCVSVLVGLAASMAWDTPAGPTIVVAATVLFALTSLVAARG